MCGVQAKENESKYKGVSSEEMRSGARGFGGGPSFGSSRGYDDFDDDVQDKHHIPASRIPKVQVLPPFLLSFSPVF